MRWADQGASDRVGFPFSEWSSFSFPLVPVAIRLSLRPTGESRCFSFLRQLSFWSRLFFGLG